MADIWSNDLTDKQLSMVMESGDGAYGVELRGGAWRTASSLVAKGLGHIEGGTPNGSDYPGLYFNNAEGVRVLNEFADEPDDSAFVGGF
ncbi:MAG: hypothetical protein ACSLE1_03080 [Sphingobium sp.]